MAVTALYVHVPFCAQKCRYCDFDSRSFAPCDLSVVLDTYFEQLYARLDAFGNAGALDQIRTVYVGGGTPSLAGERLVELARRISAWCKPVEFTCEANPESLTAELATALAGVGVTRVSLGVQTLDNAELTAIGRIHDADRALAAITTVKNAGLVVSCDLMCGLPGQTAPKLAAHARWRVGGGAASCVGVPAHARGGHAALSRGVSRRVARARRGFSGCMHGCGA